MRAPSLALALLVLLPGPALASHMQSYTRLPEHDDLGRSDEPDYAVTGVLGLTVANRVVDFSLVDGASAVSDVSLGPGQPVLAPGCTDDNGREQSGLCWLHLMVRFLGVEGMTGDRAPGLTGLKSREVRFLDARQDVQLTLPVTRVVDVNHKLDDAGASALLRSAGVPASRFVAGPTELWAWFGTWHDQNGNGVVDHEQDGDEPGTVSPRNEFQWLGGCLTLNHIPTGDTPVCHVLQGSRIVGFVWPGNHHASCGGGTVAGVDPVVGCSYVSADVPGLQAYCLLVLGGAEQAPRPLAELALDVVVVHYCGSTPESLDQDASSAYGDPLLEDPSRVVPDFYYDDRSGEPDVEARQWVAGQGYPVMFYDQSLVGATVFVSAEGAPYSSARQTVDLARARFVDVDVDRVWNPAVAQQLGSNVKPLSRTAWLLVREPLVATFNSASIVSHGQATDTSPTVGPLYASAVDPGFGHEPNDPRDLYPAAVRGLFGPPDHDGTTNSYAGHQAAPRGWLDAQPVRVMTDNFAWQLPEPSGDILSQCLTCSAGPGLTSTASVLPGPRAPGDDARHLDPGLWDWVGHVGLWHDTLQRWLEESLVVGVPPSFSFLLFDAPADGWVGNVVNATGTFHYRGYAPQACTVQGQPGLHEYAWCHPTMDGSLQDANDYANNGLEWRGQCVTTQNVATVRLVPTGGVWSVPALVLRDVETATPDPANVEVWSDRADNPTTPGNEAELSLRLACIDVLAGTFRGADMLLLPLGNLGMDLVATADGKVVRLDGGTDDVRDVDALPGW
jgi:hypothetical protein